MNLINLFRNKSINILQDDYILLNELKKRAENGTHRDREYVLAGYGTGAIMAVPAHDSRDYAFAKHFNLPIIPLIEGADVSEESFDAKEGIVTNSPVAGKSSMDGFSLNGLTVKEAIAATKKFVTEKGIGRVKVNYRLRDAIFSRQRYWGEPFPVYYKDGMPQMVPEECLPLELP